MPLQIVEIQTIEEKHTGVNPSVLKYKVKSKKNTRKSRTHSALQGGNERDGGGQQAPGSGGRDAEPAPRCFLWGTWGLKAKAPVQLASHSSAPMLGLLLAVALPPAFDVVRCVLCSELTLCAVGSGQAWRMSASPSPLPSALCPWGTPPAAANLICLPAWAWPPLLTACPCRDPRAQSPLTAVSWCLE